MSCLPGSESQVGMYEIGMVENYQQFALVICSYTDYSEMRCMQAMISF